MEVFLSELRFALRRLFRSPSFTVASVLTLGLGQGAATTLFSVVYGVLLQPLPYPEAGHIVRVFEVAEDGHRPTRMSDANFSDLQRQSRSFTDLVQYRATQASVSLGAETVRITVAQVSRGFFNVMGVQPALGRAFRPEEQQFGAAPVAVVSHEFWRQDLGKGRDLSGLKLIYGDKVVSIIGVMPVGFGFPEKADLWIPRELEAPIPSRTALNKLVIGRLAPGVSLEQAGGEVSSIAQRLKSEYGDDTHMADAALVPLREDLVGSTRIPLFLLFAASGLLLLVAWTNVVNLLLARAATQKRELALRIAIGASRWRLTLRALAEALALSLGGGVLGLLVARWGLSFLRSLDVAALPTLADVQIEGTVLLFALALSTVLAVALALMVVWRVVGSDPRASIAVGQRTQAGGRRTWLRSTLVVAQVAMTLILLVGMGLLLRSFQNLLTTDPGFRTEGAWILSCYPPDLETPEQVGEQEQFYQRLTSRLRGLGGETKVGGINALPLHRKAWNGTYLLIRQPDEVTDMEEFEDLAKVPGSHGDAEFRKVIPGYFEAMRIPLVRGRRFDSRDQPTTAHAAIVSESLAEDAWPGEDPLGRLVQFGNMDGDMRPFTVVGVVQDVRDSSLEAEPRPTFYANAVQRDSGLSGSFDLVIVPPKGVELSTGALRRVVTEIDPQVAVEVRTLEGILAGSLTERRFQLFLLAAFGLVALVLAALGVYGVISFDVAQRVREIGVRIALGATGEQVVRQVVLSGLFLAATGVVIGLGGAFAAARLMKSLLYGIATTDPVTFVAIPIVLLITAVLACLVPAYRVARIDPVAALRKE